MGYKRYRFETNSTDDYRPVIFNTKYPWWISGYSYNYYACVIICYLPENEDLLKYWPDAKNIEYTERDEIEFTARFRKPDWYTG